MNRNSNSGSHDSDGFSITVFSLCCSGGQVVVLMTVLNELQNPQDSSTRLFFFSPFVGPVLVFFFVAFFSIKAFVLANELF